MQVKNLIETLQKLEPNNNIIFYYLKNNELTNCVYETILDVDEWYIEFTIQDYDDYEEQNYGRKKEMKVALCLFGYPKGSSVYAGGGHKEQYNHLFEQVMVYNPDVFIHCWDTQYEKQLIELYQPKRSKFQEQIQFDNGLI